MRCHHAHSLVEVNNYYHTIVVYCMLRRSRVGHEVTLHISTRIVFACVRRACYPDCSSCKIRYCGKHKSQVKIDAVPVGVEWVECPVGARLEILSTPEVSPHFAVLAIGTGSW